MTRHPGRRFSFFFFISLVLTALVADGALGQTPGLKAAEVPPAMVIAGKPRERGLAYGKALKEGIRQFLDKEIYHAFIKKPSPKEEMLDYARACGKVIAEVCPIIFQELEGVAEGAGLLVEEVVLITLHEELYHRGVLPKVEHCTAVAVGPPETRDAHTYVGQTWDWMETVAGQSRIVEWRRTEGPSLLAYGFPGLCTGAGLNSAGIALCWTSADLGTKALGARVGVPSYVLLTHLLYQKSLGDVEKEALRDKHAGWFTFVVADGDGNLLNVEGSPRGIHVERGKGRMVRIGFGSRAMTGTPAEKPVKLHARCDKMYALLESAAGKNDLGTMQSFFGDPKCAISVGKGTIDMMVFDTTSRTAYLSRGPSYKVAWREFSFGGVEKRVPVVDAHLHCFAGKKDDRFPYHPRGPYQPEQAATPEHLLKCMADGGVDFALVVHPEPYHDDHRYLEHCLKVGGGRLKGTCLFFADKEDSVKEMTELVRRWPGQIVTLRIHAYAAERLPPFDKPEQIRRLWKAAGDLGLAVQLHLEPRYAPKLEPFIEEFPKTTVIVDHLGRPFQGTPEEHAVIVRWSRFDNVVMKISAIPDKKTYPHRDIQPVIKELTKAFGASRLLYGGGFDDKATGASYRAHRERVREALSHLSAAEQAQVLGGTAARLFGFERSR